MPRQHTTNVFTYEELSPEAQETAREWWLNEVLAHDAHMFLWEPIDEWIKDYVKELGYEEVEWETDQWDHVTVRLSGAVNGSIVFPRAGIDFIDPQDVSVWISSGRGDYRPGVYAEVDFDEDDLKPGEGSIEELEERIADAVKEDRDEIQYKLQDMAQSEIAYQTSDEAVAENIIANEYEFYENGRFFLG